MKKVPLAAWWLATLSALLQWLPFPIAGPVPLWRRLFCWFCLVPLLFALLGKDRDGKPLSTKSAACVGYLCGVLWYLGNCYWIYPTMHVYGALPSPVAFVILILFALYLGLYHALFGALIGWLRNRGSVQVALFAVPFAWVALELARARITGFPWDLLGYTQIDNLALTRFAPVTGVMGLSFLVAAINALWLARWRVRSGLLQRTIFLGTAVLVVLLTAAEATWHPQPISATHRAVLLQDNLSVGAEAGPRETREQLLDNLTHLSQRTLAAAGKVDLIAWPEAPADFIDDDPAFRETLSSLAKSADAPVIANSIAMQRNAAAPELAKVYNAASYFAADGSYQGRYDKMHLVPFGEYTPYKDLFFFAGHLLDNVGTFTPGAEQTLLHHDGQAIGVFICYESIFGTEVRELAKSGASVLLNLSDDGWYGDSSAPWEHLDMARMRAIENNRWLLRSTNTGVTTVIDPYGRMGASLPRHQRGALVASFGYVTGTTFYTRHGDWLGWLCVIVTLAICAAFCWRRSAPQAEAVH
ncbi:apolipoprotein N-acyltransferase [Granulicella cerasi]|uniref:Apolipoprotein N-acyltransferase n=1 Tax=Granulicella cerasi TaxID=741063 RepID=A0ABW1Z6P7_9BACT|nr:apolipoprotein N-acyltransferase [Granulicella cerasi]